MKSEKIKLHTVGVENNKKKNLERKKTCIIEKILKLVKNVKSNKYF